MQHASHPDIIKRLKRADGHLKSVIAMLEEARPCLDIAQQLRAVEAAIAKAKKELIHDHIEHCLGNGDEIAADHDHALRDTLSELKQLAKYL